MKRRFLEAVILTKNNNLYFYGSDKKLFFLGKNNKETIGTINNYIKRYITFTTQKSRAQWAKIYIDGIFERGGLYD